MEFDEFYARTYRRTVAAVFLVVGSFAEAEDLAQEAYHRALQRWGVLRGYDQPDAWVRRVAYNLAVSSVRRARTRAFLLLRQRAEPPVDSAPDEALDLYRALARLPLKYRTVLALRYFEDLPVADIADTLRISPHTVRSLLVRGRRQLESVLREMGVGDLEAEHDV